MCVHDELSSFFFQPPGCTLLFCGLFKPFCLLSLQHVILTGMHCNYDSLECCAEHIYLYIYMFLSSTLKLHIKLDVMLVCPVSTHGLRCDLYLSSKAFNMVQQDLDAYLCDQMMWQTQPEEVEDFDGSCGLRQRGGTGRGCITQSRSYFLLYYIFFYICLVTSTVIVLFFVF